MIPGRVARGRVLVAQALYRRLITPRGMLRGGPEESAYGIDLAEYVGAVGYPTAVNAIPAIVRNEFLKDDRVLSADVSAVVSRDSTGLVYIELSALVYLTDESAPLPLTFKVTDASVTLLGGTS